jgi:hypothetical protein
MKNKNLVLSSSTALINIPQKNEYVDAVYSIIQTFDPLDHISRAYTQTLLYRLEREKLIQETERLKVKARVAHHMINQEFQNKMLTLKNNHQAVKKTINVTQKELSQFRMERKNLLKIINQLTLKMSKTKSAEELRLLLNAITEMSKQMIALGSKSSDLVSALIEKMPQTQLSLPISQNLLSLDD